MIVLGLTGSIGMGKSATAQMFRDAGVPVHDADETVHRLYAGRAAPLIAAAFPGAVEKGVVDRRKLAGIVLRDAAALKRLERIIHPLVREDEAAFVEERRNLGAPLIVVDIPLLFEVGAERRVDRILVVSAPADIQRQRVLSRPGMTEAKFAAILAKQVPDGEKRARADFVIDTSQGIEAARAAVARIVEELAGAAGAAGGPLG